MGKPKDNNKKASAGSKGPAAPPKQEPQDEDVAFPRGGADALTPLERKQIAEEARLALEKEEAAGKGTQAAKGKRKREGAGTGDDGHFLGDSAGKGNKHRFVQLLNAKRLSTGTRLLGVVLEVANSGLTLSLPHGLRGHVAPEEASDVLAQMLHPKKGEALLAALDLTVPPSLPELFHVGQFVRCEVLSTGAAPAAGTPGGKHSKRIECSLRLKRVCAGRSAHLVHAGAAMPAVVRSVEDHGFTLELGIKGLKGFLSRSDHEAAFGEGATLLPGTLLDVAALAAPDTRGVAHVTSDPTRTTSALASDNDSDLGLTTMLPGTLVNAKVATVLGDGLQVKLLGVLTATVDLFHLGPGLQSTKAFKQDQKVKARVLYVDPNSKEVALSLLPHLLNMALPSPIPLLGQVFEAAPVTRVDEGLGLLLQLPLGGELGGTCPAFCHVSNVSEMPLAKLSGSFKPGSSTLKCRVIGFRLVDGLATVSARKAAMEQQIMGYKDVVPGQILKGKVVNTELDAGLLLEVAPHVTALVPVLHMNDTGSDAARKKFKVGQEVEGRVLNVDADARKMSMTLKKSLLGSKMQLITSTLGLAPGTRGHGVVTGITDVGVYVTFYGGVCGMAHVSELGLPKPGDKPSSAFKLGQVVRARVLDVQPVSGRLKLSLKSGSAAADTATATTPNKATGGDACGGLQPGDVVLGRVVRAIESKATSKVTGVTLEVWRETDGSKSVTQAKLDLPGQLADHPAAAAVLEPLMLRPGTQTGPLVVLERLEGQKCVLVSRKASMVAAAQAGRLPCTFEQVREGMLLPGFVANVTADSVFVRFGGHVTGRAGLSQLADTFVSDPHTLFSLGQSVRAQVVTVDADKHRFSVTLRPSLTASSDASYLAGYYSDLELAAQLKSAQMVAEGKAAQELSADQWAALAPGKLLKGAVHELTSYGMVMDVPDHEDLVGVIRPHQFPSTGPAKPNSSLSCRVLDVSKAEGILDLTGRDDLIKAGEAAGSKKGAKKKPAGKDNAASAKPGQVVEGRVELLKDAPTHTAVLSLPSLNNTLMHVAVTDFNAALPQAMQRQLHVGDTVQATVQVLPSAATGGRLLGAVDLSKAAKKQDKAEAREKLPVGKVLSATITAVHPGFVEVAVGSKKTSARVHATEMKDLPAADVLLRAQSGEQDRPAKKAKKPSKADSGGDAAAVAAAQAWLHAGHASSGFEVGQEVEVVVLPKPKQHRSQGHAQHHSAVEVSMRPAIVNAAKADQPLPAAVSFPSLSRGALVVGVVSEVGQDHVWVSLSPHIRGRLHILDASSDPEALSGFTSKFAVGRAVAAQVAHVDAGAHTLDLTSVLDSRPAVVPASDLTQASAIKGTAGAGKAKALLEPGALVMGKVVKSGKGASSGDVRVHLGGKLFGRVAITDISDTWVGNPLEGVAEGVVVRAAVLDAEMDGDSVRITLSLRPSKGAAISGLSRASKSKVKTPSKGSASESVGQAAPELLQPGQPLAVGTVVRGYVKRVDVKAGVFVALDRTRDARIKISNLSDGFVEDPVASFPAGLLVEGRIISSQGAGLQERLEMSLRSSDSTRSSLRLEDLQEGQVLGGRIRKVETYGVFVELENSTVVGLAHISEVSDGKVKDIHSLFRAQQTVRAKVLRIDTEKGKVSLSLKPSQVASGGADGDAENDAEGQPARKKAKAAADMDQEMADVEEEEEQGEESEEIEAEEGDVGTGVAIDDLDVDSEEEGSEEEEEDDLAAQLAGGSGSDDEQSDSDDDDDDEEEEEEEDSEADADASSSEGADEKMATAAAATQAGAQLRQRLAGSGVAGGSAGAGDLDFGGLLVLEDMAQPGPSIGEEEGGKKASKATRKQEKMEAERKIREAELARLKGEAAPQSAVEFERSVLASPNSSYTWIRYMAWLLGLGETDKARAVAQRALDTINYREEGEKFNVWVAWLNLEAAYGSPSPSDALMTLFNKAVQYCEPKKIYFALLGILDRQGFTELSASTLKAMCKRFGGSAKVWLKAIETCLAAGDGEGARKTLERATQALPQRKHIKVITAAALLEFRQGNPERGRGILEGVLRNYPKRMDLWSVYIDQEVKLGDQQRTRALFERCTSLALPAKKVKFLFKRWLEWEKAQAGGASTAEVEHVKQKAMEFVQNSMKA